MHMYFKKWLSLLCLLSVGAVAYAQSPELRLAPGFSKLPSTAKIVLMPIDIELFSLTAGGVQEPQAEWTDQASKHLTSAVEKKMTALNTPFFHLKDDTNQTINDLNSLNGVVSSAIAIHQMLGIKLPTKEGKLDWSLGETVQEIQKATSADYGLFFYVRDSYASAERKAAMIALALLGVGISGGVQVGYASLVDLKTGQIVWFNLLSRGSGDLRDPESADNTLQALLNEFPNK
jgi:hypothetical protein